ncbi:MAG: methionyl-tRNA formyltransferase [Chlamydiia bacterium]|nr:methionyl-tRNA formyltransferase [Chlamydiia bacterium]
MVFFGTPQFAAEILQYLLEHSVSVVAVVTQPDRPKGRSLEIAPSAVKQVALSQIASTPIFQPEKASDPQFLEELAALGADLFVVVVFGQILSQKLLDIPPLGSINVHPSLLPKYRGAAPIHHALLNGDRITGVSIQKIVKQLDAGDVLEQVPFEIPPEMNLGELERALCAVSKPLLLSVIQRFANDAVSGTPQDPAQVTFAPKFESEQGLINWHLSAAQLHNHIRAFAPRPGAWCWLPGSKRLKILRTSIASGRGPIGDITPQGLVYCGEGALQLLEVQPEGKKAMPVSDWLRGAKVKNLLHSTS